MACREINPTPKQYAIKSDWNECHGSHELQGMCVCVAWAWAWAWTWA